MTISDADTVSGRERARPSSPWGWPSLALVLVGLYSGLAILPETLAVPRSVGVSPLPEVTPQPSGAGQPSGAELTEREFRERCGTADDFERSCRGRMIAWSGTLLDVGGRRGPFRVKVLDPEDKFVGIFNVHLSQQHYQSTAFDLVKERNYYRQYFYYRPLRFTGRLTSREWLVNSIEEATVEGFPVLTPEQHLAWAGLAGTRYWTEQACINEVWNDLRKRWHEGAVKGLPKMQILPGTTKVTPDGTYHIFARIIQEARDGTKSRHPIECQVRNGRLRSIHRYEKGEPLPEAYKYGERR